MLARRTRSVLHPSFSHLFCTTTDTPHQSVLSPFFPRPNQFQLHHFLAPIENVDFNFRNRFHTGNIKNPLFDQIYRILYKKGDDSSINSSLAELNLHLTQTLVLDVLRYHNNKDASASLRFFDWARRQKGFYQIDATFIAICKILKEAGKTDAILEYLHQYAKRNRKWVGNTSFKNILIIGYAVSGKCDLALPVLARLRYNGAFLNGYAYHALLDSFVENRYFGFVDNLVNDIRVRGYETEVTHHIMVKNLCRQMKFDEAYKYLCDHIMSWGDVFDKCGPTVSMMVSALCKDGQYKRSALLVEELRKKGLVSMDYAYSTWISELLYMEKVDGALKFFNNMSTLEGYVPYVFRYNVLVSTLLRQKRFDEVYDLLVEMKDMGIMPDKVTLSSVLCLSCKVGRLDIAMDMYNSTKEFGLSVSYMAYNYFINTLLGDVSADQAYRVFMNSIAYGYFPGEITFLISANALCREGKPDIMRELVIFTSEKYKFRRNTYEKLIWTLCAANMVDHGYWVYKWVNRKNTSSHQPRTSNKTTYISLICGFCKLGRVEIAIQLVMKMHGKGMSCTEEVFREVICCICKTDEPEKLFFRFLEMQLAIPGMPDSKIFQRFIDGAGHARKPELARELHEMMGTRGVEVLK